jgi:hypothetical protein
MTVNDVSKIEQDALGNYEYSAGIQTLTRHPGNLYIFFMI